MRLLAERFIFFWWGEDHGFLKEDVKTYLMDLHIYSLWPNQVI